MKKRSRLLAAVLLALSLCLSLAAPALSAGTFTDFETPLWKALQYESLPHYLKANDQKAEDYINQVNWMRAYLAVHPEEAAAFDGDSYYEKRVNASVPKDVYMQHSPGYFTGGYTEADFQVEMKACWLCGLWETFRRLEHARALAILYPDAFSAFDADAWFSAYYGGYPTEESKAEYMEQEGLADEEEFRLYLFALCEDGTYSRGYYTVAVDGVPMNFDVNGSISPLGTPDDILLVPARTMADRLGLTVSYDAAARSVTLAADGRSIVFTADRVDYTVDGQTRTLSGDYVFIYENRCYIPLPELADFLGCTWRWNGSHNAVFLQTTHKD